TGDHLASNLESVQLEFKIHKGELVKKTLLGSLLCLTLLALCATGLAADKAHHPQYGATVVPGNVRPMVSPDAGQQAIFSNLGSRTDAYDATNGYFVSGITNQFN